MKKMISFLLTMIFCFCTAGAENAGNPENPFLNYTVTDITGKAVPLAEAMKEQKTVLIDLRENSPGSTTNQNQDEASPEAYILHVADQNNDPVAGFYVSFCTDTLCSMAVSDAEGMISFDGDPDIYHVQMLKAPKGYSFDPNFSMSTGPEYGEWLLCIRKD